MEKLDVLKSSDLADLYERVNGPCVSYRTYRTFHKGLIFAEVVTEPINAL